MNNHWPPDSNQIISLKQFKTHYENIEQSFGKIALVGSGILSAWIFTGVYSGTVVSFFVGLLITILTFSTSFLLLLVTGIVYHASQLHRNSLLKKTHNKEFQEEFMQLWQKKKAYLTVEQNKTVYSIINYWSHEVFLPPTLKQGSKQMYTLILYLL